MPPLCLVTDNTAVFSRSGNSQNKQLTVIPLGVRLKGKKLLPPYETPPTTLPLSANHSLAPCLLAPSVDEFRQLFSHLNQTNNEILAVFLSSQLNPCYQNASDAIHAMRANNIQLIDSQTTSAGLGILAQAALDTMTGKSTLTEADRAMRSLIPHIYSVWCTPSLTYLHYNGFLDPAQAVIGEMLGLYTIFSIEEGSLTPVDKVRNYHQAFDYFQEFLDEFDTLTQITLTRFASLNIPELRLLRERVAQDFPAAVYNEHVVDLPLAALFGPRSLGLVVSDS